MEAKLPAGLDKGGGQALLAVAAVVIIIAGIRASASILAPFLMSVFIAVVCSPALVWLQRRKAPTWLALTLVVIGITLILSLIALVIGSSISEFTNDLPSYREKLEAQRDLLVVWLQSHGIEASAAPFSSVFDPTALLNATATALTGLGGLLTNTILIILTVLFILVEASGFPSKLQAAFGRSHDLQPFLNKFTSSLKRYMALKTVVSLATGILIAVWLMILGVDYPILWGLVAFLFNYVPNIGSIIAAVPALLLAFIQHGPGVTALAAVGYVVVNSVIGNLVEPRIMGRGLGLSTLVVFISLVFWGWALGPVGMFLSVPLTMSVKLGLETAESTRAIAVILGPAEEAKRA